MAIVSAVGVILNSIITNKTQKKMQSTEQLQKDYNQKIAHYVMEFEKTYLTDFISEVENGIKKSDIQIKRAYELYEEYSKNGGNSYVHDRWAELTKKGLI